MATEPRSFLSRDLGYVFEGNRSDNVRHNTARVIRHAVEPTDNKGQLMDTVARLIGENNIDPNRRINAQLHVKDVPYLYFKSEMFKTRNSYRHLLDKINFGSSRVLTCASDPDAANWEYDGVTINVI